ncbi:TetR family transcriptional regulator [Tardiphaga sp. P9-11]|uniref:TetR family transcriptional regulator n=1 Tax=Tardiphaga sp. P9-11 TaxID=2024614 RepID=UPI0011F295D5|nr:TetR family transcriptional regulator [Tardiphaga sp. P9-11]KAA0078615.1 TetR/AcrR family transcriptional regulator [Tardiphaga sp. P9-11]
MTRRPSPSIHSRKQPQQTRSEELVSAILEAAIQVLAKEGFHRFTTARVAEKAGVSVGSLYQYFPNKASILFRLQSDEWRDTNDMLRRILEDESASPSTRLRKLVHAFIKSECDEADIRHALDDAAPLYRDAPESQKAKAAGRRTFAAFIAHALPAATEERQSLVVDVITSTLSGVGKDFSMRPRSAAEIEFFAEGLADMLCSYVESSGRHET